ncbi:uncharacterized protein LOC110346196 [Heterocephalus glaber]|uniref:Uncharacterized protein LOC110346196 n=1 Tax=Heterocephalus glaber TaxID=10181 RepID=A0AAX6S1B7_HETGA|nr:uncharacterized protein LOC110346196 [Heterocephalus glaber]
MWRKRQSGQSGERAWGPSHTSNAPLVLCSGPGLRCAPLTCCGDGTPARCLAGCWWEVMGSQDRGVTAQPSEAHVASLRTHRRPESVPSSQGQEQAGPAKPPAVPWLLGGVRKGSRSQDLGDRQRGRRGREGEEGQSHASASDRGLLGEAERSCSPEAEAPLSLGSPSAPCTVDSGPSLNPKHPEGPTPSNVPFSFSACFLPTGAALRTPPGPMARLAPSLGCWPGAAASLVLRGAHTPREDRFPAAGPQRRGRRAPAPSGRLWIGLGAACVQRDPSRARCGLGSSCRRAGWRLLAQHPGRLCLLPSGTGMGPGSVQSWARPPGESGPQQRLRTEPGAQCPTAQPGHAVLCCWGFCLLPTALQGSWPRPGGPALCAQSPVPATRALRLLVGQGHARATLSDRSHRASCRSLGGLGRPFFCRTAARCEP